MNKQLNPNLIAAILIACTVLILAVVPMQIEIIATGVQAQETSPDPQPVSVAQGEEVASTGQVVEFTLRTIIGSDPAMAYIGVGGEIDGIVNPELVVNQGDTVQLTVINGDAVLHDLVIHEFGADTGDMFAAEETVILEFVADQAGVFEYFCSIPGHREIGMKGVLRVEGADAGDHSAAHDPHADDYTLDASVPAEARPATEDAVSIVRHPADVPPPVGDRDAEHHVVELTAIEVDGILDDGTTYHYMTFDGTVPGPMLRMREGDTMEIILHNAETSHLPHSIDLHAVTGPGGGAVYTQTMPGDTTSFTFQALSPGLYVYHCATASVAHHIATGMYGLILVEPEGGLDPVDHEFYVMQGEIYTAQPMGTQGHLDFDYQSMLDEHPQYFVLNGAANALTQEEYALRAEVGDTVRIFFGVGGPNFTSSFHVIGEIFDRVYDQASLTAPPLTDVQTTLVPPGGATMVEFTLDVPGNYVLVDHALSRLERGLAGFLIVEGDDEPDIFHSDGEMDTAGH
jgi:nitrite reductase (NO-forming)